MVGSDFVLHIPHNVVVPHQPVCSYSWIQYLLTVRIATVPFKVYIASYTVYHYYNGPTYGRSLAILCEPEGAGLYSNKWPATISDDYMIQYQTECKGFHILVSTYFFLIRTDEVVLFANQSTSCITFFPYLHIATLFKSLYDQYLRCQCQTFAL